MTDFTPEHYLAVARIAYPKENWEIGETINGSLHVWSTDNADWFSPYVNTGDYRALREALDKEYGIMIYWWRGTEQWKSCIPDIWNNHKIPMMDDDDITRLMMKNVVALVEAGVLNPVLTD